MSTTAKCGNIVRVDGRASVQFAARPMWFRIDQVLPWVPVCDGWVWLAGCCLSELLFPRQRREILVMPAGLVPITDGQLSEIGALRAARPARRVPRPRVGHRMPVVCAR